MSDGRSGELEGAGTPTCDRCGSEEAHAMGEGHLCAECFQLAGSSCGGGGMARDIVRRPHDPREGVAADPSGTC